MATAFKGLFLLIFLLLIGLISFAYIGPLLGADFSAPQQEIRLPVVLNAD